MRIEGWESLLAAHVVQAQEKTFAWGEHDCALWCAEWLRLATGRNLVDEWRGLYTNEEELDSLMLARGHSSYEHIVDAYGLSKPVMLAQRGDILLHPCGTLGICLGKIGIFVTTKGAITERTLACLKAWEVS